MIGGQQIKAETATGTQGLGDLRFFDLELSNP
jgi:hypothetical protein